MSPGICTWKHWKHTIILCYVIVPNQAADLWWFHATENPKQNPTLYDQIPYISMYLSTARILNCNRIRILLFLHTQHHTHTTHGSLWPATNASWLSRRRPGWTTTWPHPHYVQPPSTFLQWPKHVANVPDWKMVFGHPTLQLFPLY